MFCRHYVTKSVYSPPSMVATLRHESVCSADITSRKVCILRPLWRRHYVTKSVYSADITSRKVCVLRPLWRRHYVTKVCILQESVYSRDVMLSNVSSLIAPVPAITLHRLHSAGQLALLHTDRPTPSSKLGPGSWRGLQMPTSMSVQPSSCHTTQSCGCQPGGETE